MTRRDSTAGVHDVSLRNVVEDDLPIFYAQQLDPEATRMAAYPSWGRRSFMFHWTALLADEAVEARAIVADGEVAGYVVRFTQEGESTVGYWLGRAFWGKGIASRALALFLAEVTTRPLNAHVAAHNVASIRVLEKCGFTYHREGVDHVDDGSQELVRVIVMRLVGDGEEAR